MMQGSVLLRKLFDLPYVSQMICQLLETAFSHH